LTILKKLAKSFFLRSSSIYQCGVGIRDTWLRLQGLPGFRADFRNFEEKARGCQTRFALTEKNCAPYTQDASTETIFDRHYVYHPAWAARILAETKPSFHVDISSTLHFCSMLSAFLPVRFYDYRPAPLRLTGLTSESADLLNLPFESDSLRSLSCMHTIEHIGLGRYGDPLDYDGDLKAMAELQRVTRPRGDLLIVTPVGRPLLAFNAHRVYSYEQVLQGFAGCQLQQFSLVPDHGWFVDDADPALVVQQSYGCGCFWFKKRPSSKD